MTSSFWTALKTSQPDNPAFLKMWQLMPDLLAVFDMSTASFEHVNPAWTRLLGWQPLDLEGEHYARFFHPDDHDASEAAFLQASAGGEPILSFENRCRCRDGTYRWLSWALVPDGARLFTRALDVTDHKNAMLELAARTIEREQIWALSRDMLGVTDAKGRWISVSPAFERILGWDESALLGRTSEWLEHPDDREGTRQEIARLAAGATTLAFKNRFRASSGGYRWLQWTAVPHNGHFYCVARELLDGEEQVPA